MRRSLLANDAKWQMYIARDMTASDAWSPQLDQQRQTWLKLSRSLLPQTLVFHLLGLERMGFRLWAVLPIQYVLNNRPIHELVTCWPTSNILLELHRCYSKRSICISGGTLF